MRPEQVKPKAALLGDGCTSIHQIMQRQEEIVILRGEAQRIFATYVATGLFEPAIIQTWMQNEAIVGRRCGTYTEGDPDYLGCAGERVWHRHPRRN